MYVPVMLRGLFWGALMLFAALVVVSGISMTFEDRAQDVTADNATAPPQ
jgi:hypothetical protein